LSTINMAFSDEDKILIKKVDYFVFEGVHSKQVDRQNVPRKARQSMVLIRCFKSCGTQEHC